jgi:hypothetical protein
MTTGTLILTLHVDGKLTGKKGLTTSGNIMLHEAQPLRLLDSWHRKILHEKLDKYIDEMNKRMQEKEDRMDAAYLEGDAEAFYKTVLEGDSS